MSKTLNGPVKVFRDPNRMIGGDSYLSVIKTEEKPMTVTKQHKPRRTRRTKSTSITNTTTLDLMYQMKAPAYFKQVEFIQKQTAALEQKVAGAKSEEERKKIGEDLDRLVRDLLICLS